MCAHTRERQDNKLITSYICTVNTIDTLKCATFDLAVLQVDYKQLAYISAFLLCNILFNITQNFVSA